MVGQACCVFRVAWIRDPAQRTSNAAGDFGFCVGSSWSAFDAGEAAAEDGAEGVVGRLRVFRLRVESWV